MESGQIDLAAIRRSGTGAGYHRFTIPHGHGVPSHHDRLGHLVYPATGVLSITTEAGTWIAPATRVAWTPSGCEHHHRAHGYTDMRVLFLPDGLATRLPDHPVVFAASALVREAILTLTGDADGQRPDDAQERIEAVIVDELVPASEEPLHLPEPHDDRLQAISHLLHHDPANNDTLDELGRQVGAGRRTLTRMFHDELGMSFRQWRTQLRLHHALTRLAAGDTVAHTAVACGWSNPTSFIAAFTAALGQTPGHYRSALSHTPTVPARRRRSTLRASVASTR